MCKSQFFEKVTVKIKKFIKLFYFGTSIRAKTKTSISIHADKELKKTIALNHYIYCER